jgi:hypothetical protein
MTNPKAIRSLYVFHRRAAEERLSGEPSYIGARPIPSWDGGTDRQGRTFKPVWPKIAAFLDARGFEPYEYMESVFGDALIGGIPMPNQLISSSAENAFRDYLGRSPDRARIQLDAQKLCFLLDVQKAVRILGVDENEAALQVLKDPELELISLFRYCMGANCGADEIARLYREPSLQFLALHFFAYSSGWGDFIPATLLDAAADIVAMLSECGAEE